MKRILSFVGIVFACISQVFADIGPSEQDALDAMYDASQAYVDLYNSDEAFYTTAYAESKEEFETKFQTYLLGYIDTTLQLSIQICVDYLNNNGPDIGTLTPEELDHINQVWQDYQDTIDYGEGMWACYDHYMDDVFVHHYELGQYYMTEEYNGWMEDFKFSDAISEFETAKSIVEYEASDTLNTDIAQVIVDINQFTLSIPGEE